MLQLTGLTMTTAITNRFDDCLARSNIESLRAVRIGTLQINVGKFCNQTCRHCHVDAGPHRVAEQMTHETAESIIGVLRRYPELATLDITGGAPELNAEFRYLVTEARALGRSVIDRCNLTVLALEAHADLAPFLAQHRVHIIASLPCYLEENVDKQRGSGVFAKSIAVLRQLNALGYGRDENLPLDLVFNPQGAGLPPPQAALEQDYKRELRARHGIEFNRLLTITNMPIARFRDDLAASGKLDGYMELLETKFNPAAAGDVMCRSLISVGWDGRLFDCDFNQMLELPLESMQARHIRDFDLNALRQRRIRTGDHCLGCTAGAGSSCAGALK
jgi:radical SAM/Cys-rich protein